MKKFKPKPGQIDFTKARWAPVINCVVQYKDKILIVKRSSKLNFYPNYWNGISGFLDDHRSIKQKVGDGLREELEITKNKIISIKVSRIFNQEEPKYKKTWIVHPILVQIKTDKIKLDWEAQNYKWINLKEIKHYKLLPGFDTVVKNFFK